jgi:hypothetical protein
MTRGRFSRTRTRRVCVTSLNKFRFFESRNNPALFLPGQQSYRNAQKNKAMHMHTAAADSRNTHILQRGRFSVKS